jgi:hypothetical protein
MLEPGTRVSRDQLRAWGMEPIDSLIESGFLVQLHAVEAVEYLPPGAGVQKPLPVEADKGPETHDRRLKPPPVTIPPVIQQKSMWTFDPAHLADKTLEALNVMILENHNGPDPFVAENTNEAIAWLSQDFVRVATD